MFVRVFAAAAAADDDDDDDDEEDDEDDEDDGDEDDEDEDDDYDTIFLDVFCAKFVGWGLAIFDLRFPFVGGRGSD